ncbi:hypothetical protein ABEF95_002763 [Exophiala dermatitidis]
MSGNYRAIDPRVYGIHIRSTPRASISGDTNNKGTRDKDKDPSDASHNRSSGTQSSSTSSTALDTTSNPAQGVTQFIDGTRNGELLSSLTTTTTPTISSTIAPHSSRREPATTDQQAKHEQRRQRLKESHNRRRRERIAKKVCHEIDSDGEREYWRAVYDRSMAESARREALSPEARRQEDIESAAKAFRSHIEPILAFDDAGVAHLQHYPLFLLQRAPDSHNGAACRLPHCSDRITPGQYRIAVSPGSWDPRGPDHYHVQCFEHLLDLSSLHYVARFEPDRRKHIPDQGACCILEEYISRWRRRLRTNKQPPAPQQHETRLQLSVSPGAESEHVIAESSSRTQTNSAAAANDESETAKAIESQVLGPPEAHTGGSAALDQIPVASSESVMQTPSAASRTGTATQSSNLSASNQTVDQTVEPDVWNLADMLWAQVRHAEAEASERHNKLHDIFLHLDDADADPEDSTTSPQSHPPTNQDRTWTWHITQYLLADDHPDYDQRHALSRALEDWNSDIMLANADLSELTEAGRAAKEELGEMAIKRIKRYQNVRMPDYQSLFLRGR